MAREMKGVANMIHVSMCKNHRFNARMSMAFSFQNFIQISVQFSGSLIATHIHENTINLTLQCHTQLVARPSEIIIFFSISDSTMRKNLVSVLQFLSHIRKNTKILYFLQKKYYLSRKFLKNLLSTRTYIIILLSIFLDYGKTHFCLVYATWLAKN